LNRFTYDRRSLFTRGYLAVRRFAFTRFAGGAILVGTGGFIFANRTAGTGALPFVRARFGVARFGALRSIFAILGASGFAARGSFRFSITIMALFASQGITANGNCQDKSQRDNQDERIFFQSNLLKIALYNFVCLIRATRIRGYCALSNTQNGRGNAGMNPPWRNGVENFRR
jgi:hypothetical protein